MAAGLAEGADGDEHPRTGEEAGVDRHADAGGGAGRVAHRREACFEGELRGTHCAHQLEGRRRRQLTSEIETFAQRSEMDVAVDEAGQQREAGGVDRFRIARHLGSVAFPGLCDSPVLDDDDRISHHFTGGGIKEGVAGDGADHQPMLKPALTTEVCSGDRRACRRDASPPPRAFAGADSTSNPAGAAAPRELPPSRPRGTVRRHSFRVGWLPST